jgi:hypothetical protein
MCIAEMAGNGKHDRASAVGQLTRFVHANLFLLVGRAACRHRCQGIHSTILGSTLCIKLMAPFLRTSSHLQNEYVLWLLWIVSELLVYPTNLI